MQRQILAWKPLVDLILVTWIGKNTILDQETRHLRIIQNDCLIHLTPGLEPPKPPPIATIASSELRSEQKPSEVTKQQHKTINSS